MSQAGNSESACRVRLRTSFFREQSTSARACCRCGGDCGSCAESCDAAYVGVVLADLCWREKLAVLQTQKTREPLPARIASPAFASFRGAPALTRWLFSPESQACAARECKGPSCFEPSTFGARQSSCPFALPACYYMHTIPTRSKTSRSLFTGVRNDDNADYARVPGALQASCVRRSVWVRSVAAPLTEGWPHCSGGRRSDKVLGNREGWQAAVEPARGHGVIQVSHLHHEGLVEDERRHHG